MSSRRLVVSLAWLGVRVGVGVGVGGEVGVGGSLEPLDGLSHFKHLRLHYPYP